jgi:hypothetical protein
MTREELELKAKEFDSKLKRHPMSSEELQNVLCDFVEALRIHDVSSLLKAEREATKEEIREWLIAEDFEGLAERL